MIAGPLASACGEGIEHRFCPKTQRGNASYLKKASSAVFHTLFSFWIIYVAIPAIGPYGCIVVAPVTELLLVGMAVQTGVGEAHVKELAFGVDERPLPVSDHVVPPYVQ
jgi:hypothetical protein